MGGLFGKRWTPFWVSSPLTPHPHPATSRVLCRRPERELGAPLRASVMPGALHPPAPPLPDLSTAAPCGPGRHPRLPRPHLRVCQPDAPHLLWHLQPKAAHLLQAVQGALLDAPQRLVGSCIVHFLLGGGRTLGLHCTPTPSAGLLGVNRWGRGGARERLLRLAPERCPLGQEGPPYPPLSFPHSTSHFLGPRQGLGWSAAPPPQKGPEPGRLSSGRCLTVGARQGAHLKEAGAGGHHGLQGLCLLLGEGCRQTGRGQQVRRGPNPAPPACILAATVGQPG